jgi:hypothetical protein
MHAEFGDDIPLPGAVVPVLPTEGSGRATVDDMANSILVGMLEKPHVLCVDNGDMSSFVLLIATASCTHVAVHMGCRPFVCARAKMTGEKPQIAMYTANSLGI